MTGQGHFSFWSGPMALRSIVQKTQSAQKIQMFLRLLYGDIESFSMNTLKDPESQLKTFIKVLSLYL